MKVVAVYCDEDKVSRAGPGENLRVKLSGIEEEEILTGFVLSSVGMFCHDLAASIGVIIVFLKHH